MKKNLLSRSILLVFPFLIYIQTLWAQAPDYNWALNTAGDEVYAVATDPAGNLYTAGHFSGTRDFDPGANSFNLTAVAGGTVFAPTTDIFVSKLDKDGNFKWARKIGSKGNDKCYDLAVDPAGNILLTGTFSDTVDFDPGNNAATLISLGINDMYVCKLNANGTYAWAKQWGSNSRSVNADYAFSIATDSQNNIYTTGHFRESVDFDPGPNVQLLTTTGTDIFVSKLDTDGNFEWVRNAGSTSGNHTGEGASVVVAHNGTLYVTGYFTGIIDFNNTAGGFPLDAGSQTNYSGFIWKLDTAGHFIRAGRIGGTNATLIMGASLDDWGHLYVCGYFRGTTDFNPSPSDTFALSSNVHHPNGGGDAFVVKLDTAATNFIWVRSWGGSNSRFCIAWNVEADVSGNVFTVGEFTDTVDFDPGTNTFIFGSQYWNATTTFRDGFVSKLDSSGNFSWAGRFNGPGMNRARDIALDPYINIYIAGDITSASIAPVDLDPTTGISLFSTTDFNMSFLVKLSSCFEPKADTILGPLSVCPRATYTYSLPLNPGVASYSWELSPGLSGSSATNSIAVTIADEGTISVIANGYCDTSAAYTLNIGLLISPATISVNGFELSTTKPYHTYQWVRNGTIIPGATDSTYTVTENGEYTVWVTGPNGCTDTSAVYLVNNVNIRDYRDPAPTVRVYPNPATDIIHIIGTVPVDVILTGIDGRTILESREATSIPIKNLEAGIYLLQIADKSGSVIGIQKVIVSR